MGENLNKQGHSFEFDVYRSAVSQRSMLQLYVSRSLLAMLCGYTYTTSAYYIIHATSLSEPWSQEACVFTSNGLRWDFL